MRMERDDATMGTAAGLIEDFHFPCVDVDHLDPRAVETLASHIGAGVVNEPAAVGRPYARVGEDPASGTAGDLFFHKSAVGGFFERLRACRGGGSPGRNH